MKGLNFVLLQTLGIPFKSVKVGQANREGVNSRNHQATALGSTGRSTATWSYRTRLAERGGIVPPLNKFHGLTEWLPDTYSD